VTSVPPADECDTCTKSEPSRNETSTECGCSVCVDAWNNATTQLVTGLIARTSVQFSSIQNLFTTFQSIQQSTSTNVDNLRTELNVKYEAQKTLISANIQSIQALNSTVTSGFNALSDQISKAVSRLLKADAATKAELNSNINKLSKKIDEVKCCACRGRHSSSSSNYRRY
jgi:ribosome-associated toxin RatA of RatAB toxin-antitoxin module